VRALLAIVLFFASFSVAAAERFFAEYHLAGTATRHTDLKFRSLGGRLIFGGYFAEGLGAQISVGGPFRVGEDQGFTVQLENFANASLRFDSPPLDGLSAYIALGVSQFTVSQRGVNSIGQARTVRETFQSGSLFVGLQQRYNQLPFSVVGGYQIHYVDQPLDIDAWTLGLRATW